MIRDPVNHWELFLDFAAMTGQAEMLKGSRGQSRTRVAAVALVVACGLLAPHPAQAQFFWEQPGLSSDDAARVAIRHGFRVLSRPMRNDDVYVAQVINRRGDREQVVIAADSGRILQRYSLDDDHPERVYRDPSIPPGPVPPGRVPTQGGRNNGGFFARLFGNDGQDAGDVGEPTRPAYGDRSPSSYGLPNQPVRGPRPRRQSRALESAPETIHQEPIESAPLAPPSAVPSLPRTAAPPRPAPARVPAQASLPAPSVPASPTVVPAPVDRSGRAISSNPLAIPGSREQDEKTIQTGRAPTKVATPAPVKPDEPAKAPVAVAPLE